MLQIINSLISDFLNKCRLQTPAKPLLVLLGPTASGKTALSLEIAKQFGGEIISADSRQVYKYMDIGTDKIPPEAQQGIPHYLIDIVEPDERFTVADFKKLAVEKIEEIEKCGKLSMLVGGTGLYIRSITQNFAIPLENPLLRQQLLKELEEKGPQALHEKLAQLDPENAAKISPNNAPYIVRALEIFMTTGKPKIDRKTPSPYQILQIGLNPLREILFKRIEKRVDEQINRGLTDEVKKLLQMGYPKDLPSMRTLGYREIVQYLEGKISLEQAVELIKQNTRNFAKHQMVWFKKDEDVVWVS